MPVREPRDPAKLPPEILEKVRIFLEESDLTPRQIAMKAAIDHRWIAPIKRYLAKQRAIAEGKDPDLVVPAPQPRPEKLKDPTRSEEYLDLVRRNFPIKDRVRFLRELMDGESSDQVKLKILEKIDSLEGLDESTKAPPVPLFQITDSEEPDLRKREQQTDIVQLWLTEWRLIHTDDGFVSLEVSIGRDAEERVQAALRALKSGMNLGLRGREYALEVLPSQLPPQEPEP
jgi:hypothetical protein